MRLAGRILLLLVSLGVPAGVAGFGCNGDLSPYPGVTNDIPNSRGGGVAPGDTSVSSSGASSSAASSSSSGMPAGVQTCQCAASAFAPGTCSTCTGTAVNAGGMCAVQALACQNDPTLSCSAALVCVTACASNPNSPPTCVQDCIQGDKLFEALAGCFCTHCATCLSANPVPCDLNPPADAGAD